MSQVLNISEVSDQMSQPNCPVSTEISPRDAMYGGNPKHYFGVGYSALRCIKAAIIATEKKDVNNILDFPCGHGRVLRTLRADFPDARIYACDLDRDGVDFCAKTFNAIPIYSSVDPRKVEIKSDLDLIWVGSLFTHFNQDNWDEFLQLFAAHLAPNGLLVFTTHGRRPVEWIRKGVTQFGLTRKQMYGLENDRFEQLLLDYDKYGFSYENYPLQKNYGISLSSPSWVMSKLQIYADLRIVMYLEHGWDQHQDVVACIKSV
jgi:SAM-dependent methyltransferase